MQAVLLVGGKGTRLQSMYSDRPKALVPILDRPFIEWQVEWLAAQGVQRFHLSTGHMSHLLEEWAAAYLETAYGIQISFSREPEPLGTGGGVKFCQDAIESNPFLVINGDSIMPNLKLDALLEAHKEAHALATMAVTEIEEAGRYGTVEFDENGVVTAFREKANREAGWINGGVYLLNRAVLADIPEGEKGSLETDIFPALTSKKQLRAHASQAPLLDMGTPDGIAAMESFFRSRNLNSLE